MENQQELEEMQTLVQNNAHDPSLLEMAEEEMLHKQEGAHGEEMVMVRPQTQDSNKLSPTQRTQQNVVEMNTKHCDACGQEVLAPGFDNHRAKCTEKKDLLKGQTPLPTIDSSLRAIREFVMLNDLDVDTHLSERNNKTVIIEKIYMCMSVSPEKSKSCEPTTVHCKICGWEVLKPGYRKHLWKCIARQERLKKTTPVPQKGAPLREIKEFINLHKLNIDTNISSTHGKDEMVDEILAVIKPAENELKNAKDPDIIECELCGWQVLKPGFPQHAQKCKEHFADLRKVTPLPTTESSLREIREFVKLHQLKLDTKLTEEHSKDDMLEEIKKALLAPREGEDGQKSRIPWEELPAALKKDHVPETLHCQYCGWEVLKPGYHEHIKICKEKHESLKKTTPIPNEESSLRELRQFVQLHGFQIDTKVSNTRCKQDILQEIQRALEGGCCLSVGSLKKSTEVETIHCSLCGWEVLKPGYNQHRWKCVAKYEKLRQTTEVPTTDSNLREIREFSEIHQMNLDTKLSSFNTKEDMIHSLEEKLQEMFSPTASKLPSPARSRNTSVTFSTPTPVTPISPCSPRSRSRSRSRSKSGPAYAFVRSRIASQTATDPQTVHCDLCGWEVLKPGYAEHHRKCVVKFESLRETTQIPNEHSNLRDIKEFISLHKLDVDTKISPGHKKKDIIADMEAALKAKRKSESNRPKTPRTPGRKSPPNNGPQTVMCKLCGWEVLKPGYQKHLWKCAARQELVKEKAEFPTENTSLREIREYAALYQLEGFDSKISSTRKKADMISDLRKLLNMPSEEDEIRERERSKSKKSKDPETLHCEICGWEVLKPGYLLHLQKCREKNENLRDITELPTLNSSLREIREFIALHGLHLDTKLSNKRKKEDIIADILAHLPELEGKQMERERAHSRSASQQSDPQTVHCKICGWEVLKPGYNKHLFKCAAKQTLMQSRTPLPSSGADLREIREFVQLHQLDIDTKMTAARSKEDMLIEIKAAMSSKASPNITSPSKFSRRNSLESTPSAGVQTVHCTLCGWEVLKPGYQEHRWKCVARAAAQREVVNLPTEDSPLRDLREYVVLNQLDVDTKLTTTRKKGNILKDINTAMSQRKPTLDFAAFPPSPPSQHQTSPPSPAGPYTTRHRRTRSQPTSTRHSRPTAASGAWAWSSPKGTPTSRNSATRRQSKPSTKTPRNQSPKRTNKNRSPSPKRTGYASHRRTGSPSPKRTGSASPGQCSTDSRRSLPRTSHGSSKSPSVPDEHQKAGSEDSPVPRKGTPFKVPTVITGRRPSSDGKKQVGLLGTVQCEKCRQQVLEVGLQIHLANCQGLAEAEDGSATLRRRGSGAFATIVKSPSPKAPALPLPTEDSDLQDIVNFVQHHELEVDTTLDQGRSKANILEDIKVNLSQKYQSFVF